MIECKIVSYLGHEEKTWDPSKPGDLEEMKKFFKEQLARGFRAFALGKDGKSTPIKEFNEDTERIILTSDRVRVYQPVRGG